MDTNPLSWWGACGLWLPGAPGGVGLGRDGQPFMVNAYFHPSNVEIVFPAAILRPPFFVAPTDEQPFGDPAVNYGGIGAVRFGSSACGASLLANAWRVGNVAVRSWRMRALWGGVLDRVLHADTLPLFAG